MNYIIILLLAFASYLIGSFPSGYILAKYIKKIDLTNHGSKHTGATNTTRILGVGYGLIAAFIDVLKGTVIMTILYLLKLEQFYLISGFNILPFYGLIAALGHVFSFYLNFKGGKAVATSFGVLIFISIILNFWWLAIFAIPVFILTIVITRYVSLGSILGAFAAIVTAIVCYFGKTELPFEYMLVVFLLGLTIIIKHHENIKRLINGNENKIGSKKS